MRKSWIVYVSTFPSRQCGIATFTQDLTDSLDKLYSHAIESKIAAVNPEGRASYKYPAKVLWQISADRREDYAQLAVSLNANPQVRLVNIQHEFGIFGGEYGAYLLDFLGAVQKPVIITFHTVLPNPSQSLKKLVQTIANFTRGIVVMTSLSRRILSDDYGLNPRKIELIPHGIPPITYEPPARYKNELKLADKLVLSTFGFLSSNKGIEYVLDALPEVVKKNSNLLYLVIGATHPEVLRKSGEAYRNFLIKKIDELKLANHVQFYNSYLRLPELIQFLRATDIYLAPSLDPNQAVSGTLSYALGMGRPVIATAFAQAKELVTEKEGILVGFRDAASIRGALFRLAGDPSGRVSKGKEAYFRTRSMTWPNVAIGYARYFQSHIPELRNQEKNLPPLNLNHMLKLTDRFGMIQFSKLTEPDQSSGYTVDDNARALTGAIWHWEQSPREQILPLIGKYLDFLKFTILPSGYFANYVESDHTLNIIANRAESPEDPTARALFALATAAASRALPQVYRDTARQLFKQSFRKNLRFTHVRASANYLKSLCVFLGLPLNTRDKQRVRSSIKQQADFILKCFQKSATRKWQWFETKLTYSNAILPEALVWAYEAVNKEKYLEIAKRAMDFLLAETFQKEIYLPIGQDGWYQRSGKRTYFDQQPEDASAMVQALRKFYTVTGETKYRKLMYQAFSWFLGDNLLKQTVYDRTTGGCYDGIGKKEVNLNQGAESTLSYLLARLALRQNFAQGGK